MKELKRLNEEEKKKIIGQMGVDGWDGCTCDYCLMALAKLILKKQLKKS